VSKEIDSLPPNRPCDLEIKLKDEGKIPPFLKIYRLARKEEDLLKVFIEENLRKGFIRPSKSPYGAPIFFVPKPHSTELRPCINYKLLNENTVPDGRPLPLVSDILSQFEGSQIYTCLDLKGAYNLVRIKQGDEYKAAFRSKFGLFEPLVVQFGLQNAPSCFQDFINSIFVDLLDKCLVIYLDDLVIYSKDLETHVVTVREVLERLRQNHLILKEAKCKFHVTEFVYLGHVVSVQGIRMDPEKLEPIRSLPPPTNVKELRSFLGMTNYYRKFIPKYSEIALPLTELTKKRRDFLWNEQAQQCFDQVKSLLIEDAMLCHPMLDKPFVLQTDASDFAIAAALMQLDDKDNLRPVEFLSRKLIDSEKNYSIHDKELLSIKEALEEWRNYLIYAKEPTRIYCDHRNLLYFKNTRLLKPRHARWTEILLQFNFVLIHIAGADNVIADVLSRNPKFQEDKKPQGITVLPEDKWESQEMLIQVLEVSEEDPHDYPEDIAYYLSSEDNIWNCKIHPFSAYKQYIKKFKLFGNRLFYIGSNGLYRYYLPIDQREKPLRNFHDNSGHLGFASIINLIKRRFYWPHMEEDVKEYIKTCSSCQLNRPPKPIICTVLGLGSLVHF
jgi:hypothetical protein